MTVASAEGINGNYPGKGIGTPVGIAVLGKGTVGTEVLRPWRGCLRRGQAQERA